MTPLAFDPAQAAWPVGTDSFFQPRRAAFWLLAVLIVNGLFYTVQVFSTGFRVVPVTAFLGLAVWGLYALAFILAFRALDLLEQHSPEAFLLAFAWGGFGAVYFAAPANVAIQNLCAKLVSPEFAAVWGPAIAGPITEEFLKLAGVVLLVLVARTQFQTTLSVLIVGAMTGLGFQVVENLSDTVSTSLNFPRESQVAPVLLNLLTRGILSGLWTHAAYTTIASFGVAWFLLHPQRPMAVRLAAVVGCFALAWAMHFVWNSPLLEDRFGNGYGDLAALLVVKGIPAMAAAWLLWRVAARENGAYLHELAAYFFPERDLIADDEWLRLGAPVLRYQVRRAMGQAFGRRARRLKTQLQREQLRLIRKAATYGRGPQTVGHEQAVRRLRAALDALVARPPMPDAGATGKAAIPPVATHRPAP
ncbi:PrsW family intramembrane metalloprotease [Variovorax arabinosiphilus]|uniref:PrsW family intramembrane metalloprotease n=1 Tax=Variovorax arabinosiphilus TaxID=3053498 RepID=UPI002578613D|nr:MULTISPECIES: PrsW family glutamic-type intramembrane protease [unclassified Variovorax]MDM0119776.1 PrsW family glutamic-type intramembrane protease [Variovorax sp. J2L1-78]MDM0128312.1 PrsW family glutamic-type intramembrane protease [Variovorax sp. J2L1-63]MDM0232012.1 PrsW family glutamic-type intramembrane protease [Variovorax sp. J2R1-6]